MKINGIAAYPDLVGIQLDIAVLQDTMVKTINRFNNTSAHALIVIAL